MDVEPVIPPLFKATGDAGVIAERVLRKHFETSLLHFASTYRAMREAGVSAEEAREVARVFLPQCETTSERSINANHQHQAQ